MKKLSLLLVLVAAVSCKNAYVEKDIANTESERSLKSAASLESVVNVTGMKCYLDLPESNDVSKEVLVVDASNKDETLTHEFYEMNEEADVLNKLEIEGTVIPSVDYVNVDSNTATHMVNAEIIEIGANGTLDIEYDVDSEQITLVRNLVDSEGNMTDRVAFLNNCQEGYEYSVKK